MSWWTFSNETMAPNAMPDKDGTWRVSGYDTPHDVMDRYINPVGGAMKRTCKGM